MHVTVDCRRCRKSLVFDGGAREQVVCPSCRDALQPAAPRDSGCLERCVVCAEGRLYRQKDLNRNVGLAVVVGSALLSLALLPISPVAAYAVLFAMALVDFAVYRMLPEVIICYRCKARHRRCGAQTQVEPFDLLTAEVIDQQVRERQLGRE